MVPGQHDRPTGCLLSPRCTYAVERCRRDMPPMAGAADRRVRCHFPLDAAGQPTGGWASEAVHVEGAA
jgi:dipeptide transport system ATP-binding protein